MMRIFKRSLFKKIFLGYIIMLTLVLGFISYIITSNYAKFIEEKTIKYNTENLSLIIQSMDKYTLKLDQVIYSIYKPDVFQTMFVDEKMDTTSFEGLKKEIEVEEFIHRNIYFNSLQEDISNIIIYRNDNNFYHVGNGAVKSDLKFSSMEWYKKFAESNLDTYAIGPFEEDYLQYPGEKVLLYIKRVYPPKISKSNEKPSFIMISIKFRVIEQMLQQFMRSQNSGLMILNEKNKSIYTWNVSQKLNSQLEKEIDWLSHPEVKCVKIEKGDEALLTSYFVKGFNWRIVSVDFKKEMLTEVNSIVNKVYLLLITGGIIALLLSVFISYEIIIPVRNMNTVIKKVQQGNFEVFVKVRSEDEIGQLGNSFNIMVQKIKELIDKVYVAELIQKEAKIEALQAQINPHFLFNTLDNINSIARVEGVELISNITQSLSAMFRYSIREGINNTTIGDELEHVRNFMHIMNVRFDNKINYTEELEEEIISYTTTRLMLQPIVENAVRHGIAEKISCRGNITVSVKKQGEYLEILVRDDGAGMSSQRLKALQGVLNNEKAEFEEYKPKGSGIGLKNVHDRLQLLFGNEWGISIDSREDSGTVVMVRFPARKYT